MPVQWIPGQDFYANAYVYENVLIDAGALPMAVSPHKEDIEVIVLTHCHFDHIAHVVEISHMCDAKIAIHAADADGLNDGGRNLSLMFGVRLPLIVPDIILSDGDRVGGLEVLHTPGHTPGSISLYSRAHRILFSGDTVFTNGGFGRFDFPGGSVKDLKASLNRLGELDVDELYPGHEMPVREKGSDHIAAAQRMLTSTYLG